MQNDCARFSALPESRATSYLADIRVVRAVSPLGRAVRIGLTSAVTVVLGAFNCWAGTHVDLNNKTELDLQGRWVSRLSGFNPGGAPGVADGVPPYFSADARLAWHPRSDLELSLVGQNLLDSHHPEFGTSPLVRSPFVEIRRGACVKATWQF